jgi:hypothetical protein
MCPSLISEVKEGEKNQYNKFVAIALDGSNSLLFLERKGRA